MTDMARRMRLNTPEELYAAIGYGGIQLSRLMIRIKDEVAKQAREAAPPAVTTVPIRKQKATEGVIVEGLDNCPIKFAKCCNPLPGDEIVGFITRGFGVSIHKKDCANARAGLSERGRGPLAARLVGGKGVGEGIVQIFAGDIGYGPRRPCGRCGGPDCRNAPDVLHLLGAPALRRRASLTLTIAISSKEHLASVIQRMKKNKERAQHPPPVKARRARGTQKGGCRQ